MTRLLRLWHLTRRHGRPVPGVEDTGLVGWVKPPRPGPRCVTTLRFYADGTSRIDDHLRRRTIRLPAEPGGPATAGLERELREP